MTGGFVTPWTRLPTGTQDGFHHRNTEVTEKRQRKMRANKQRTGNPAGTGRNVLLCDHCAAVVNCFSAADAAHAARFCAR